VRGVPDACFEALKEFFARSPAARKATRPLSRDARVNLVLPGGPACFSMADGAPALSPGAGQDPDFTLTLPAGAVRRITSLGGEDVGEHGVEFFRLALEKDPALKVRVQVDAPTARLLGHGYLGVLALGGLHLARWLLREGVRYPAAAIDRLRRRR
jgi:hypothetical protein